jgi:Dolichyl-phosphate-mannose-protein mannosyltransferase
MKANFVLRLWRSRSGYERALLLVFLVSLLFLHPIVNGDGIGYYAYVRSLLVDHNLQFSSDWPDSKKALDEIFLVNHFIANPITKTGHIPNFYAVGPAILWSPFLGATHLAVLGVGQLGWQVAADGHSRPYVLTMAVATALYGFLGVCLAFAVARRFVDERWAFWAAMGVWLGSSLSAYMYLQPSWSHAHSAFAASLFLWYWVRTREKRTTKQWLTLGLLSGLMVDVYQLNVVFCLAVGYEALWSYAEVWRSQSGWKAQLVGAVRSHAFYAAGMLMGLMPTFIARQIVFGSPIAAGPYTLRLWNWTSPAFALVLFSASHGLLVFTPIVVLALVGLLCLLRQERSVGSVCLLVAISFYALICCFPWPLGAVGFGNRFFVSLTPIFVLGLASLFARVADRWRNQRAAELRVIPVALLFMVWNLGLLYQWQTHMIAWYGGVYWEEVVYNQFRVVPGQALHDLGAKFVGR